MIQSICLHSLITRWNSSVVCRHCSSCYSYVFMFIETCFEGSCCFTDKFCHSLHRLVQLCLKPFMHVLVVMKVSVSLLEYLWDVQCNLVAGKDYNFVRNHEFMTWRVLFLQSLVKKEEKYNSVVWSLCILSDKKLVCKFSLLLGKIRWWCLFQSYYHDWNMGMWDHFC